ncbi:MAG: pantetheine-phosphate adenylyltransferase [Planctomycetota bacterium]|nr:pantetheine-phosphate adenylyltransferase [Planctomycetota bacterium]MDI6786871.1 pantetheine-phosphate adenylyltransferase [Planctomycetota bacterium]
MNKAVYAGTFDPITKGHIDVIERGTKIFNNLIVAVADNPSKNPTFSREERINQLKAITTKYPNVKVDSFGGLLIDYVRKQETNIILRGIRTISDFEYEFQMALTNRAIAPDIETIFVMACEKYSYISSRLLKEAISLGADVGLFVPAEIQEALRKKLK